MGQWVNYIMTGILQEVTNTVTLKTTPAFSDIQATQFKVEYQQMNLLALDI